jgi:hypothetical protein
MGPITYQILHPWHWLTFGQNSSAVQAVGAIVFGVASIVIAIFSLLYLISATTAAQRQAVAADTQAAIARATLREQVRPFLKVGVLFADKDFDHEDQVFVVTNAGSGSAVSIYFQFSDKNDQVLGEYTGYSGVVLPPDGEMLAPAQPPAFHRMAIYYRSTNDEGYVTGFTVGQMRVPDVYAACDKRPACSVRLGALNGLLWPFHEGDSGKLSR